MLSGMASVFRVIQARKISALLNHFLLLIVKTGTLTDQVRDPKLIQWISRLPAEKVKGDLIPARLQRRLQEQGVIRSCC